ncbi:hypothetical protein AALP_AA6G260600 [Arabis alpina]|uniref:Jacalin-type lectin domain-containing protein n=1 Tax=Arabis alpina TaxID=50452 RepID=A0A087GRR9_ARAAL|nr:hypothetical protein AALP_AA6G260600 [Arabis alpina]
MELFTRKRAELKFNDGRFEGIRRIWVRDDCMEILYIGVEYGTATGGTELKQHGESGTCEEFVINYPDEYITCIECTYGIHLHLRQLVLVTSNGRRSRRFGSTVEVDPVAKSSQITRRADAPAIVGFHGRFGTGLVELKAHFGPAPPRKEAAIGGVRGEEWDDGKHDSVAKIQVGRGMYGIASLKFYYVDGTTVVHGEDHGMVPGLDTNEFEIAYENDHLVSVDIYCSRMGNPEEHITALQFKTHSGQSSDLYGIPSTSFTGHKIVGFHGRSSDQKLHSLGVRVSFPPVPHLSGSWSKVTQKGEIPKPRCSNAIAMVGKKMYSFGGQLSSGHPMDKHLYIFDVPTRTWSRSPARGDVPEFSCVGASMVSVRSTLYVFGGKDHSGKYNGFHSFDTVTNQWELLTPVGNGPRPRSFHSMAAIEDDVYVFGGLSATGPLNTLEAYNIHSRTWKQWLPPGYPFAERERAGLKVVDGKLWVLYGFKGSELDDVHCFDPNQEAWTEVNTIGEKPCPRSAFASAVFGNYLMVFGGETPSARMELDQKVGGTFSLDTETNTWERLDEKGTPSPRGSCASTTYALDGHETAMIVFSGQFKTNLLTNELYFYYY